MVCSPNMMRREVEARNQVRPKSETPIAGLLTAPTPPTLQQGQQAALDRLDIFCCGALTSFLLDFSAIMPSWPGRYNFAAVLQPVQTLLLLLLALLLHAPPAQAFTPTPGSISTSSSTSIRTSTFARTLNTCPSRRHRLVRCWEGIQPPSPPPSKPLSTSSPTLPAGTWPQKGFRPFRSLREENGDVSIDLDEHQQSLVTPPTSQFFAGFRLRELDEINKNTFLKETGRVQQGLVLACVGKCQWHVI